MILCNLIMNKKRNMINFCKKLTRIIIIIKCNKSDYQKIKTIIIILNITSKTKNNSIMILIQESIFKKTLDTLENG